MNIQSVLKFFREPVRLYNFAVHLPNDFGDSEVVENRAISVEIDIPGFKIDSDTKIAPGYSIPLITEIEKGENLVIEFLEDEDKKVFNYFMNWRNKIMNWDYNSSRFCDLSLPKEYKRTVRIDILKLNQDVWSKYSFIGAYPVEFDGFNFGYEKNDVLKIKISFEWDYLKIGG